MKQGMWTVVLALLGSQLSAGELTEWVSFKSTDLTFSKVRGYDIVAMKDAGFTYKVGEPKLPLVQVYVALPPGAKSLDGQVVSFRSEVIEGEYAIYPSQPPRIIGMVGMEEKPTRFVSPKENVYSSSSPYPGKFIELTGTGNMGGHRIASFLLYPVQYSPAKKELRLYTDIGFRITYSESKARLPLRTKGGQRLFLESVKGFVINPEDVSYLPTKSPEDTVEYLIISDSVYAPEFQYLADWKEKKGLKAEVKPMDEIVASYPGYDEAEMIRNCIKDYANHGTIYVLLAGDADRIPTRVAYAMTSGAGHYVDEDSIRCDLYYSDLDGSWDENGNHIYGEIADSVDMYPDVFVGRAPVKNALEAATFVEKCLKYEKSPPASNYVLDMLFFGFQLDTTYWEDNYEYMKEDIDTSFVPPRFSITKKYESNGGWGTSQAVSALNSGHNIVNHGDHCNWQVIGVGSFLHHEYLTIPDMDNLTNSDCQSIFYTTGCWPAAIDYDCIAEHFVNSPDGGGVAFIGNSRYGWYEYLMPGAYSGEFDQEFFNSLFTDNIYKAGHTLGDSKIPFIAIAQSENVYRWCEYELNLLGDPELPIFTDNPETLVVAFPETVSVGLSDFTVTVTKDGTPVPNALVCVSMDSTVYEKGYTDGIGEITLSIFPVNVDSMWVTVTAQNSYPYEGYSQVISEGAYVSYFRYIIDDDTLGMSDGNGDSIVNPMEQVELPLWVINYGQIEASGVYGILSTADTFITILTDSQYFGDIAPLDSVLSPGAYVFRVDSTCPDKRRLDFDLTCRDTLDSLWISRFTIIVHAPVLVYNTFTVDDSGQAEPNGALDPGETVELIVALQNIGSATATQLSASLHTADTFITVIDSSSFYGDIAPDSILNNSQAPFIIHADSSTPLHRDINFSLNLTCEPGYEFTVDFTLRIGIGGDFLVVDFDPNHSSGPEIKAALEAMGYIGNYTHDLEAFRLHLSEFTTIFICLGICPQDYVMSEGADVDALCFYLDQGGRIYLEGGDAWSLGVPDTLRSYFHIRSRWYGYDDTETILGQSHTFTNGMNFTYQGENTTMDRIIPESGAWSVFENYLPQYSNGIAFTSGKYKTIGTSFEFGGMEDGSPPSTKQTLVDSVMKWFKRTPEHDVCVYRIDSPLEIVEPNTSTNVEATVKNLGTGIETFPVICTIDSLTFRIYCDTVIVPGLEPDSSVKVAFNDWWVGTGSYTLKIQSELLGDEEFANDFQVIHPVPFHLDTIINSPYVTSPPAIDGNIDTLVEWSSAIKIDIRDVLNMEDEAGMSELLSVPYGDVVNRREVNKRRLGLPSPADSAYLYVMNDSSKVYFGVDACCDNSLDNLDIFFPFFDDNHDGSYPSWPDSSEGYLILVHFGGGDYVYFQPYMSDSIVPSYYEVSIQGKISISSGHVQYELALPLGESNEYLNASPGDTVGIGIIAGNLGTPTDLYGWWPQIGIPDDPEEMGDLVLGIPAVGIEEEQRIPSTFALFRNSPNPFGSFSVISYQLPVSSHIRLVIYDIAGRLVRTLVDKPQPSGWYQLKWNGKDDKGRKVGAGVYFYRLNAGDFHSTKKLVLIR